MERYKCKLCPSRFQNGRALGGHMRSHVVRRQKQVLASLSSPPAEAEPAAYRLRQNPKRSVRLVDPEFASSAGAGTACADSTGRGCAAAQDGESDAAQDGESDAESAFRRNRRRREDRDAPLSSITDASSEEDVARCLVLFSRDAWARRGEDGCPSDEAEEISCDYKEEEEEEEPPIDAASPRRLKYRCSTCGKFFRSYQALGGHRASHRRVGAECIPGGRTRIHGREPFESNSTAAAAVVDSKLFQCSHCYRVFTSGQALGGHKRTHLSAPGAAAAAAASHVRSPSPRHAFLAPSEGSIDLNLPPPLEEDELELSGLSVATAFPPK